MQETDDPGAEGLPAFHPVKEAGHFLQQQALDPKIGGDDGLGPTGIVKLDSRNYYKMTKEFNSVLIASLFPFVLFGQSKNVDCRKIKDGTFYFNPSNTQSKYVIVRDDSIQEEINCKTNDTTFWKVSWQDDCMFYLRFIRKSHPISDGEKYFYNSHTTVFKVIYVAKDYYTFKAGLDSIPAKNALTDTLWLKAR